MHVFVVSLLFVLSLWVLPVYGQAASVNMAWDYNGTGYTNFQMRRCTAASLTMDCVPTPTVVAAFPITQKSYTDTTVVEDTRYCYQAVAVRAGVPVSIPSNTICKTVPVVVLGGPTNLRELASPAQIMAKKRSR